MTAATRTPLEHRRRTASALVALLGLAWAFYFVYSLAMDRPKIAVVHAVAAAAVAVIYAATRGPERTTLRVHAAGVVTVLALIGIALFTGQGSSLACWYLPLVPLFVAIVAGWRAVVVWGFAGVGSVGLVHLSERFVTVAPDYVFTPTDTLVGSFVIVALALGYLAYVQRLAEEQLEELEGQRETIGGQKEELAKVYSELARLHETALLESNAKTRLMARVSHEIRTPLNGLLGLSEVLADAPLDAAHLEMVRSLHASASALRQLVDDLLDVTRIQDGRVTLHVEPTDLRELLGDVVDMFGVLAYEKGVQLAAVIDASVPARVSIDGLRVRQIAANLVGNALKFTASGEVVVHVAGTTSRDRVFDGRVEVRDTGPGIAKDLLPRMFEAFEQADEDVPLRRQGTGLGLWISRELARALGGELGATSERGRGSTFFFTFKASGSEPTVMASSAVILAAARVLVIEPHEASRQALREHAEAAGFELHEASSLKGALAEIRARPPDIVIVASEIEAAEGAAAQLARVAPDAKLVLARSPIALSSPIPAGYVAATLKPYRASRLRSVVLDVLPEESSTPVDEAPVPRMRCLVVDDDETNRMVARLLLERAGQEVILASDTKSAEAIVREGNVDVVFQDVHMPEEDGVRFVARLRAEFDASPPLWIVATTAATSEAERRAFDEAGMDDFLAKPIEVGLLRAALERAHRATRRRRRTSTAFPRAMVLADRLLDPDVFDALADNLEEDMAPLVTEFTAGSLAQARELRAALAEGDREAAKRAMHTLKSSSALLGASRLASLARFLEQRIDEGAPIGPKELEELEGCREASVSRIATRLRSLSR